MFMFMQAVCSLAVGLFSGHVAAMVNGKNASDL
jgi:hypothetical protein